MEVVGLFVFLGAVYFVGRLLPKNKPKEIITRAAVPKQTKSVEPHQKVSRTKARASAVSPPSVAPKTASKTITGKCYVIDGDTIVIGKTHIRLYGIDAPELDHPYGQKSKWAMVALCKGQVIRAELIDDVSYDRLVGKCFLPDGRDLSAELVKKGLAIDWPKYSGGEYLQLETADARKKMWRAAARQKGRMPSA